jgi:hypothetical protein
MSAHATDPLQSLADAIVRRGLREPAIFMLELCKPLVGFMRELYGIGEPLLRSLVGNERTPQLREVLESSERVEQLIVRLERGKF